MSGCTRSCCNCRNVSRRGKGEFGLWCCQAKVLGLFGDKGRHYVGNPKVRCNSHRFRVDEFIYRALLELAMTLENITNRGIEE